MNRIKAFIFSVYFFLFILICEISLMCISDYKIIQKITLKIMPVLFLLWLIIFIIIIIKNILFVIKLYKQNNAVELLKNTKYIKLSLIPFWVINFIVTLLIMIILIMGTRGFGIILIPIPVCFAYFILLVTSSFSIAYILLQNKNKKIKNYIIHIILQLCFVLDIIDTIYILNNNKEER